MLEDGHLAFKFWNWPLFKVTMKLWHFAFEIWSNGCEAYLVIFVFYISRMGLANGKRVFVQRSWFLNVGDWGHMMCRVEEIGEYGEGAGRGSTSSTPFTEDDIESDG
jgi:hypothetical protein